MSLTSLRAEVAKSIQRLYELGYVLEQEGNVSAKAEESNRFLITPSQLPRYVIKTEDVLVVDGEGNVIDGERNPSVELGMHLAVYSKRPDVGAVIHSHSIHATTLAALHETIPPFLEELIPFLGENIPTTQYAMAGSQELASNVASAFSERNAVLIANHGAVVCGRDLEDAFHKAKLLEKASTIYLEAKKLGGPKLLPTSTIETGRELFRLMLS